ncbi:MAG: hypothetical protein Q8M16_23665 [Pirellulaceae bacterium]|nr:hypothetical protein [Pirellulaceae bacterium]
MHGIDRPVLSLYQVLAVGFGLTLALSSGCRLGESWSPKMPNFGGSGLVFGAKPKDEIDPPALSFKPSEFNTPASNRNNTQLAGNAAASGSGPGQVTPRAPYSFQESSNPRERDSNSTASRLPDTRPSTGSNPNPPASALGQLPPSPGGVGQVGYDRLDTPRSDVGSPLGGLGNSVVNSPLLPSGQNPSSQREIRGIPGGSLGNPLGSSAGNTSSYNTSVQDPNPSSPSGLPSLPPSPMATSPSAPTSSMSGLPSAGSFSPPRSTLPLPNASPGLPAPASTYGQSLPPAVQPSLGSARLPNLAPAIPPNLAPANPAPASPVASNGTALEAPPTNPAPARGGFLPGSVGSGQPGPTAAPTYRQTQHGAYPGLPAWPGSNGAPPSAAPVAPAGLNQSLPSAPTTSHNSTSLHPTSMQNINQRPTSGSSALPSFPVSGPAPGQVVCDGEQCVVR